ncbi:tail fiber assembly protein [Pseudomonas extremaustralis]|uniref:Tail fiber assembly protein n=1 Tax=Pseudomonas extremaustralis TaxID=359110 RepID=A0A5C5QD11_9PSED|nr:tail fiber assembly protein [Pseudomonas extremaustralis]EZI28379.1 hypothetical protein PE143B_0112095 [Pseudomonas extremaustralis 14-3 substr. 14-3b]TWS03135.1 tail fiber assembly protein [Pseudomonas extremaustralis]SDE86556.1 virus tail fibre assembly protein, lambda gpK [Pseudomonas extremaustralis]
MSGFAVRNDGEFGWRSVGGPADLFSNEVYSKVEPPALVLSPPSVEELAVKAKVKRDQFLAVAANRMGPLQDAVEVGGATDEEVSRLALWKAYRIELNRIEGQEAFPVDISWPVSPDDSV